MCAKIAKIDKIFPWIASYYFNIKNFNIYNEFSKYIFMKEKKKEKSKSTWDHWQCLSKKSSSANIHEHFLIQCRAKTNFVTPRKNLFLDIRKRSHPKESRWGKEKGDTR